MIPQRSFSLQGAKPKKSKQKDEPLNVGSHLCVIKGVRDQYTAMHGFGFFIDFVVLAYAVMLKGDGGVEVPPEFQIPTPAGRSNTYVNFPNSAKGGGRMTPELAYQREQGKIQLAVAACLGLTERQAEQVDDDVYNRVVSVPRSENGGPTIAGRPLVSPLVDRLVVVNAVYYPQGKSKQYLELKPYLPELFPHFVEAAQTFEAERIAGPTLPVAAKTTPALPSAPKKTFEQAMEEAGYELHSADPSYCHNGQEVIEVAELRTRLGF
jgi:hypothetical protein